MPYKIPAGSPTLCFQVVGIISDWFVWWLLVLGHRFCRWIELPICISVHLWSLLVKSLTFSQHGSLASRGSLAHWDGSAFSVSRWVKFGWSFQVSRIQTTYLTWSGSHEGNWCFCKAQFDCNVLRKVSSSFAPLQYSTWSTSIAILDWFPGFFCLSVARLWSSWKAFRCSLSSIWLTVCIGL